jgi:hypothetical protein
MLNVNSDSNQPNTNSGNVNPELKFVMPSCTGTGGSNITRLLMQHQEQKKREQVALKVLEFGLGLVPPFLKGVVDAANKKAATEDSKAQTSGARSVANDSKVVEKPKDCSSCTAFPMLFGGLRAVGLHIEQRVLKMNKSAAKSRSTAAHQFTPTLSTSAQQSGSISQGSDTVTEDDDIVAAEEGMSTKFGN